MHYNAMQVLRNTLQVYRNWFCDGASTKSMYIQLLVIIAYSLRVAGIFQDTLWFLDIYTSGLGFSNYIYTVGYLSPNILNDEYINTARLRTYLQTIPRSVTD